MGRSAISFTGSSIFANDEIFGTLANIERRFGRQQAQRRTIGLIARVVIHLWLSKWMYHPHVHRSMHHCCHRGTIVTSSFVASFDRLDLPISPVDIILPNVDGKYVVQIKVGVFVTTGYESDIVTVKVRGGDVIFTGIRPENFSSFVGYGECIRPTQVFVNDDTGIGTVHA